MFDGRDGITPLDEEIVSVLRRHKRPIFYAVNKIDSLKQELLQSEFHQMGIKPLFSVSAEHGGGIDELMEEVLTALPDSDELSERGQKETIRIPRIAVVGRPNVGKSTFINRLLGEERMITSSVPGTTRDAIDSDVIHHGSTYCFIDTAGIRRRGKIDRNLERYSISRALSAIERSDIALVLLDGGEGVVEQDTKIVGRVLQLKKACILVVNKVDLHQENVDFKERIQAGLSRKLVFIRFAPMVSVSALKGFRPQQIFTLLDEVMRAYTLRVPTAELNRAFEKALTANPPSLYKGKPTKLYYITQARSRPPEFVVFSNDPGRIKESYKRYLENFLRKEFNFVGTPLELLFRQRRRKGR